MILKKARSSNILVSCYFIVLVCQQLFFPFLDTKENMQWDSALELGSNNGCNCIGNFHAPTLG